MKNKIHPVFFMLIIFYYSLISFNAHAVTTSSSAGSCYPDLPKLTISLTGVEEYGVDNDVFTRFLITTTNNASIPAELFSSAPHLPACGQNRNSARSWVSIFDGVTNDYLYGFCALGSSSDLNDLWFPIKKGDAIPEVVYVEINDRECRVSHKSNIIPIELGDIPVIGSGCKGLTQLTCDSLPEVNELFDWAAENYPDLFEQGVKTSPVGDYFARYYLNKDLYLGSRNRQVYGLGDVFNGYLEFGSLDDLLSNARTGTAAVSCLDSQKLVNDSCVDLSCQVDAYSCPVCEDNQTLEFDAVGNGSCQTNTPVDVCSAPAFGPSADGTLCDVIVPPTCSVSQKLEGDRCVAMTCQTDQFNCPTCTRDQTLAFSSTGEGFCETNTPISTCLETQKLQNGICVNKTCEADQVNCPLCDGNQTLVFNATGDGICAINIPTISACPSNLKLDNGACVAKTCRDDGFQCITCGDNQTLKYFPAGEGYCETNALVCSASEKLQKGACVTQTCEVDKYNCPSCGENETLIFDGAGNGSCQVKAETLACSNAEKVVNGSCVAKNCKDDEYNCPSCRTHETLTFDATGNGACQVNLPTCSAAEKLVGESCAAKSCQDDGYNCPSCGTHETLIFDAAGNATCQVNLPTCSAAEKLVGESCVAKNCQNDGYNCPSCGTNETLTFGAAGSASCVVNAPVCSTAEKVVGGSCVALNCQSDGYNCPSCGTNETLTFGTAGSASCVANAPVCSTAEKVVGGSCVALNCQSDGYNCPSCGTNETLTFGAFGNASCVTNVPVCSAAEKLEGGICVAKNCQVDSFGCPSCGVNETLTFDTTGGGFCETNLPTCLASEKLENGSCVAKNCLIDDYACPSCGTNETLKFDTTGGGYCDINVPICSGSQALEDNLCVDLPPVLVSAGLANSSYYASGSYEDGTPEKPFNNTGTWLVGDFTGWIEVDLGKPYDITSIELLIDQSPNGQTTHEVWLSNSPIRTNRSGAVLLTTATGNTNKHDLLTQPVPGTDKAQFVQINTTNTPSWVAWMAIRIYGK